MNRKIWMALALAGAALGPAACGERDNVPETGGEAPDAPAGISAANGRVLLPAVAGNPGAVYFDLTNAGERDKVVRAASLQGAGNTTMHETVGESMQEALQVMLRAGETVKFEPGGLHLMVGDLADTVSAGGTAEVTLTFVGGDKISFPAEVRAAGDAR